MRTYSVSKAGLRALLWRSARMSFAITVLLIAIALRMQLVRDDGIQKTGLWVMIYLLLVLVIGTWLTVRSTRRTWQSYRLEVSPDGLRRTQFRLPEMAIAKAEVSNIEEIPGRGLVVRTADSERFVFIPSQLADYTDLRTELSEWAKLRKLSATASWGRQWLGITAALLMVGWMVATMISDAAAFVLPSAFAISVFLLWTFIAAQRSLHLDRRMKLAMWCVVFPILALTLKSTKLLLGFAHP